MPLPRWQVEKYHESVFGARSVQEGSLPEGSAVKWHCRNCGYVHEGTAAPEKCPVCQHPQAYFEVTAENY
jgi:rubrerythrin